jgi:DNA-directed RNA polymerase subunit RPC12/RpoP
MANFYCKHCGAKNSSVQALTSSSCTKSPTKKHELYEGSEKSQYTCKHCGIKNSTIYALTASSCMKSPTKYHEPAL